MCWCEVGNSHWVCFIYFDSKLRWSIQKEAVSVQPSKVKIFFSLKCYALRFSLYLLYVEIQWTFWYSKVLPQKHLYFTIIFVSMKTLGYRGAKHFPCYWKVTTWNTTQISLHWYFIRKATPFQRPWRIWLDNLRCICRHFIPQCSQPVTVNSSLKEPSLT